jgi:Rap1a immunity proteins
MSRLLFTASILTMVAVLANSQTAPTEQTFTVKTTSALADLCANTSGSDVLMTTAAQNFCHGYLLGAYQVLEQVNAARGKPAFCIPSPSPSRNQAIIDFVSWTRANPSEGSRPPVDGVYEFLTQRFPCSVRR